MERDGIFAGDDPFEIARRWLDAAEESEINDPNAVALATADADGLPNVRMVLLKEIDADGVVFYTNYRSAKGKELEVNPQAAMVLHWKSLRRQVRLRGHVTLMAEVAKVTAQKGANPPRPPFWGGFRITPVEIEFWADGTFRLHDRFVWRRNTPGESWKVERLSP
jgi:pyridoxamine 5'-phosphate oxidase